MICKNYNHSDILNNELHANLSREQVKEQMYGKWRGAWKCIFGEGKFSLEEMQHLSIEKKKYQQIFLLHLKLIDGCRIFLQHFFNKIFYWLLFCNNFNIDFVLYNLNIRKYFMAIVRLMMLIKQTKSWNIFKSCRKACKKYFRLHCFEDAPKVVEAAANANMQCVVIKQCTNKMNLLLIKTPLHL